MSAVFVKGGPRGWACARCGTSTGVAVCWVCSPEHYAGHLMQALLGWLGEPRAEVRR